MVASVYGAMFAPRPERVASELVRVCRVGGTIAMANWTKKGFVGSMFQAIAKFIGPPGMPSPVLWGDEPTVVDFFRDYGPANRAFGLLSDDKHAALRGALVELRSRANESRDPMRTVVNAEYLEVLATRS